MSEETNDTLSGAADGASDVSASTTPAQDTQAVSDTPSSDAAATTAAEEKLYAGKYKSAEELEKAYVESQKLIGDGDARKKAELLDKVASTYGVTHEQLEEQIAADAMKAEAEKLGVDPAQYAAMQSIANKANSETELELKMLRFDTQFESVTKEYPQLADQKETLRTLSIQTGKSAEQLVSDLYSSVIEKTKEAAVQKLDEKVSNNPTASRGDSTEVQAQDTRASWERASVTGNARDIAEVLRGRSQK